MWVQIKWWDCWPGKMHFLGKCLLSSTQLPGIIPFYNLTIYQRNCWYHSWWGKNKQHWIVRFWYSLKKAKHWLVVVGGQLVCLHSSSSICHNKHWTLRSGQFRKKPKIFASTLVHGVDQLWVPIWQFLLNIIQLLLTISSTSWNLIVSFRLQTVWCPKRTESGKIGSLLEEVWYGTKYRSGDATMELAVKIGNLPLSSESGPFHSVSESPLAVFQSPLSETEASGNEDSQLDFTWHHRLSV